MNFEEVAERREGQVGQITLVGTMHRELGQCNENELLELLKAIDPDVIFEELRPADHEHLYNDESKHTVEMRAICSYLKIKSPNQVPVDDFTIPEGFKESVNELFTYVETGCEEYRRAVSNINRMAFNHGYRFLSSLKQIELRNEADELFEAFIANSGSDHLKGLFSAWCFQLRKRESAMLENIYDFCRKNSFKSGVYLVGAGHISYLARNLERRLETEPSLVEWRAWNG